MSLIAFNGMNKTELTDDFFNFFKANLISSNVIQQKMELIDSLLDKTKGSFAELLILSYN